jgi:hypothetical protein
MIVMALWPFKGVKGIAEPSTEYFRLLGFEKPESVNLNFPYYGVVEKERRARGESSNSLGQCLQAVGFQHLRA